MYTTEGRIKDSKLAAEIGQGLMGLTSSYAKKDVEGLLEDGLGILRAASGGNQKAGEYAKKTKTSPADVVSTCLSSNKICNDLSGTADLLERLWGFSNQYGYNERWASHRCHDSRGLLFHYASLVADPSDAFKYQAFITVLSQNKNLSYLQLLVGIRTILKPRYSQKPQLTSSHPIVSRGVCESFNGG